MTTTTSFIMQSRTSLLSLGTLTSATYIASSAYNASTNDPWDVVVEVEATPGTVSGNKQLVVFIQASLDGTNFQTGPTSGTTTTDELNLTLLGTVPCNTNSTLQRKMFSVQGALGFVPAQFKVIVKNDTGAALASGNVYTAEISAVSA